jgi:hypothetical protein
MAELRADFSEEQLPPRELAILANLLARIDAANEYLDRRPSIVRNDGTLLPVVTDLAGWERHAAAMLNDVRQREQPPEPVDREAAIAWLRELDV